MEKSEILFKLVVAIFCFFAFLLLQPITLENILACLVTTLVIFGLSVTTE